MPCVVEICVVICLSTSHDDVVSLLAKLNPITSKGTKGRSETQKMMD